jgi:hypothetical protein
LILSKSIIGALLLFGLAVSVDAHATPVLVAPGGAAVRVAGENREITFRTKLKGNESSVLTVEISGGTVLSLTGTAKDILLGKRAKPWKLSLERENLTGEEKNKRQCLPIASSSPEEDRLPSFDELGLGSDLFEQFRLLFITIQTQLVGVPTGTSLARCSLVSDEVKQRLGELMTIALSSRGRWDIKDTCLFLDSEYLDDAYRYFLVPPITAAPTASPFTSSYTVWRGVVRKDACKKKQSKSSYEIVFTGRVKTRKPLLVRISESSPVVKKAATIKPISVGKFSPAPLLLMESLGLCDQLLNKVTWQRGAPSVTPLTIEDVISYRGLVLNRSNISLALSGGRGVFDLDDGRSAYGVCMTFIRTRQRVNGYP